MWQQSMNIPLLGLIRDVLCLITGLAPTNQAFYTVPEFTILFCFTCIPFSTNKRCFDFHLSVKHPYNFLSRWCDFLSYLHRIFFDMPSLYEIHILAKECFTFHVSIFLLICFWQIPPAPIYVNRITRHSQSMTNTTHMPVPTLNWQVK